MIIIITGKICSGKSVYTAALREEYEARGVAVLVLELDAIGHEVLREVRGDEVDRAEVARLVFASEQELEKLERETHPRIMGEARTRSEQFLADNPDGVVLIESPLPLDVSEYPWLKQAQVQVLQESYEERRARARKRGMSAEQFELRDKAQRKYVYE